MIAALIRKLRLFPDEQPARDKDGRFVSLQHRDTIENARKLREQVNAAREAAGEEPIAWKVAL